MVLGRFNQGSAVGLSVFFLLIKDVFLRVQPGFRYGSKEVSTRFCFGFAGVIQIKFEGGGGRRVSPGFSDGFHRGLPEGFAEVLVLDFH